MDGFENQEWGSSIDPMDLHPVALKLLYNIVSPEVVGVVPMFPEYSIHPNKWKWNPPQCP